MNNKNWTFWTSYHLFQYCFYSWQCSLAPHLIGYSPFESSEGLSEYFWSYLNYGHTHYNDYPYKPLQYYDYE